MMGVDGAHTTVTVNVVSAQQQVIEPKTELAVGVAGRQPDFDLEVANFDDIAVTDEVSN